MSMLIGSVVCFAIAALGGIVLAVLRQKDRKLPYPLSILHGVIAAVGLVLLIIGTLQASGNTAALIALILFIVAALGGFVLFSFHLRDRKHPLPLIYIHGLLAVVAFIILLTAVL